MPNKTTIHQNYCRLLAIGFALIVSLVLVSNASQATPVMLCFDLTSVGVQCQLARSAQVNESRRNRVMLFSLAEEVIVNSRTFSFSDSDEGTGIRLLKVDKSGSFTIMQLPLPQSIHQSEPSITMVLIITEGNHT